jgi:hypothetical protein
VESVDTRHPFKQLGSGRYKFGRGASGIHSLAARPAPTVGWWAERDGASSAISLGGDHEPGGFIQKARKTYEFTNFTALSQPDEVRAAMRSSGKKLNSSANFWYTPTNYIYDLKLAARSSVQPAETDLEFTAQRLRMMQRKRVPLDSWKLNE